MLEEFTSLKDMYSCKQLNIIRRLGPMTALLLNLFVINFSRLEEVKPTEDHLQV